MKEELDHRNIEQVTKDRFHLGKAKIEFARKLDVNDPEACIDLFFRMAVLAKKYKKVIIALYYYAIYQACRAAVFHTYRNDVDMHEKVASEIGKIDGEHIDKYEVTNVQFKEFVEATGYVTDAERNGSGEVWNVKETWHGFKSRTFEGVNWRQPHAWLDNERHPNRPHPKDWENYNIMDKMDYPVVQD